MQKHAIKIYTLRAVTVHGADGRPKREMRSEWTCSASVEADSVDEARARVAMEVRRVTGKSPRSISSLLGGGFSAMVSE